MEKSAVMQEPVADKNWHALPVAQVLEKLNTTEAGLSRRQLAENRAVYGKNMLPAPKPPALINIFLRQFLSPLIYILLAAGILSIIIGEVADAFFIFTVITLNAVLGTLQEFKAEKSAAALQNLLKITVRGRRDGKEEILDAEELVPGDMVIMESGNRVPADIRLTMVNNLSVDESLLTGESVAREKSIHPLDRNTPVSDQANMVFAGSTVMSGRGAGVVTGTAADTELGKIAGEVTTADTGKPPLLIRMEKFSRQISYFVTGASGLLAVVSIYQGMPPAEVFFLAVALTVSAIPEGLPVALTVALSIATSRMVKQNVIVRKLTAVESLGSCTYIASDKTGTLTVNMQTVKKLSLPGDEEYSVSGEGYNDRGRVSPSRGGVLSAEARERLSRLSRAAVICNEATLYQEGDQWRHGGDAVDVALLALGYKMNLPPGEVRSDITPAGIIPFESERRYAAAYYRDNGDLRVAVKGALETLLPFCNTMLTGEGPAALDAAALEREAGKLADNGFRVIAVAEGILENPGAQHETTADCGEEKMPPLTLLGLVGLIDPLRPEVRAAVDRCRQAGIRVAMVTGDHPATSLAIARELGIANSQDDIVTGNRLGDHGGPDNPGFLQLVRNSTVFARVTPLQKLYIVEALIKLGHFVAVTGDGANDAPALRKANIGVAMGSGTDVAKDTAAIIVTDDRFSSIQAGVEQGRIAYDNIRKVIYLLISTGLAEVVLFMMALVFLVPLPLLAVQLLWLNLVTNGIQHIALTFESGEDGTMERPPRKPSEGIFNRLMVEQTIISGLTMGLVAFAAWYWLLQRGLEESEARNLVLLLMVLFENFHVFNCRSEYLSALKVPLRRNVFVVAAVAAAFGIHIISTYIPVMQEVLKINPVSFNELVRFIILASSVLAVMEIYKYIRRRRLLHNRPPGGQG